MGGGGAREVNSSSTRKPLVGATSEVLRETADWTQSGLTLGTSTLASTCGKIEGLDVTLDNPADFADRSQWMIECRCVIHE